MSFHRTILVICFLFANVCCAMAASYVGSHLDPQKLPAGCATCHLKGNFKYGGGPGVCLICHGEPARLDEAKVNNKNMPKGFAPREGTLKNIEPEFKKPFRHPTFDIPGEHSSKEILPEIDPRAPRHSDCVDCHAPHFVSPQKKFAGIRGKRVGNIVTNITQEYELCYKCHAESANLPGRFTNKRAEFAPTNPSFHPVEGEGKNLAVVSLLKPYREKKSAPSDISMIGCGDCHGSDNADSPKGPHGSNYQHILVENYSTKDNQPESPFAYALCYRCHNRTSILGDESFRFHSLHVKGKGGGDGTSCYTCHNSHGSSDYRYLIRFNKDVVMPNSKGMLKFVEKGISTFHGECYLSCHGVDHNPKSY